MYTVTIINDNKRRIIHDNRASANAQKLLTASIVDAVNSISTFQFTIHPFNDGYDMLHEYTTHVVVRNNKRNRDEFVGRVLQINPSMDSSGMISKTVICEDRLGYLQDSVQPYMEATHFDGDGSRTGLEEFIDLLLANHNAQVEAHKRIYRGEVTVDPFKSSDSVSKGLNWETTFNCITEKLINSFGGYIRLREVAGVLYLDYLSSVGTTRSTTIEVGRNMQSVTKDIDPSGIITRLVALGAKLKKIDDNGQEQETDERLTVASENDGLEYIESEEYLAEYGIKYGTVTFDDVSDAVNLLKKGKAWLKENNGLSLMHDVKALDLSQIGLDIDDFVLYDSYPVRNAYVGINDILQIIKKTTNVIKPHESSFEMGDITKRLSDILSGQHTSLENVLTDVSQVASNIKNQVTTVYTYIDKTVSAIQQTPEQIWAMIEQQVSQTAASTNEGFAETVRNILQMEADGTTMIFQNILKEIARVEGVESSHYEELVTNIRFSKDGIEIGKEGNVITMRLDNERLAFFNNGMEVAYISNDTLYITDGRFLNSLRIGNYGFVPEADNSVSFTFLGGGS